MLSVKSATHIIFQVRYAIGGFPLFSTVVCTNPFEKILK